MLHNEMTQITVSTVINTLLPSKDYFFPIGFLQQSLNMLSFQENTFFPGEDRQIPCLIYQDNSCSAIKRRSMCASMSQFV